MSFNFRTATLAVSFVSFLFAIFVFALGRDNVDTLSTGNVCSFADEETAQDAARLGLSFTFKGLNVEAKGLFASKGTCRSNEAKFMIRVSGVAKRTVPGLVNIWPFTTSELEKKIEDEFRAQLGANSLCKFKRVTVSLHE